MSGRLMAGRIRNRLDLRRQAEAAESRGPVAPADTTRGTAGRRPRGTAKGAGRVCARWGVFDGSMKLVATFDYNQRGQADQKAADLNDQRRGTTYFVQMVKETMSDGPKDDDED